MLLDLSVLYVICMICSLKIHCQTTEINKINVNSCFSTWKHECAALNYETQVSNVDLDTRKKYNKPRASKSKPWLYYLKRCLENINAETEPGPRTWILIPIKPLQILNNRSTNTEDPGMVITSLTNGDNKENCVEWFFHHCSGSTPHDLNGKFKYI